MPPKNFTSKTAAAPAGSRRNDRKRDTKVEEPAPGPSGPIIRATITKAPPAPQGMSFLDAVSKLQSGAAESVAAAKPAAPQVPAVAAADSSAPTPCKSTPRTAEPAAEQGEETSSPVQEELLAVPAEQPGAGKQYNWAEDEYTDIQQPEPQPEAAAEESPVEEEDPKPQFYVEYPEAVLNNRAEILFKAPLGDHMTLASALEQLHKERYTFQLLMENSKKELEQKESELASREQILRRDREILAAENAKLVQQQAQLAQQQHQQQQQQQQQQQVVTPPLPQQASLMNPAAMHHLGQIPPPQSRYNAMGPYHGQEGWAPDPSYDMYSSFPPRHNYRVSRGGVRNNSHGYYQQMGYPQNRSGPVPPGNFPPGAPRAPNRAWPAQ